MDEVPVYGSGWFTNYSEAVTVRQGEGWVEEQSIPRLKIKIGESWGQCRLCKTLQRTDRLGEVIHEYRLVV